jgi:hypothetical protein
MTITTQKTTETRWDRFRTAAGRFLTRITTVFNFGIVLLLLSLTTGIYGYRIANADANGIINWSWTQFWVDYYANISAEFGSVAITVLIIDTLNQRRQKQEEKGRLIRQMGNKENGIALQAVEELRALNAHKDGSLRSVNLEEANLHGVRLGHVDMRGARMDFSDFSGAHLFFANLERADMSGVNFCDAALTWANLRHADLVAADLRGALLSEADLTHAKLDRAHFNERTQLPDGSKWQKGADLTRFTDPNNPHYWRSESEESPAYVGRRGSTGGD